METDDVDRAADDRTGTRTVERYVARRIVGWEQRDGAVVLQVEGGLVGDEGAAEAAASVDQIEVAIGVLESGTVRLTVGLVGSPAQRALGLLSEPIPALAPLAVETTADGLCLTSERRGGYGPDPKNIQIEIGNDPLTLAVLDSGGRPMLRLDAAQTADDLLAVAAPLSWTYVGDIGGLPARALPRRSVTIALPLEPDEHLYGLDVWAGPLDRVGSTYALDPPPEAPVGAVPAKWCFLLSSRGPGLFVHTRARVTADLGAAAPTRSALTVEEATLDLFLFPATWPRTALAAFANLSGRPKLPAASSFGVQPRLDASASDGDVRSAADRLRAEAIPSEAPRTSEPGEPLPVAGLRIGTENLRQTLQAALELGLAAPGCWPPPDAPPPTSSPELYVRWAQTRLLMPFAHIPMTDGAALWDTGEPALSIVRAYAELRYRLLPYLLHCANETAEQGLPMLRPLLLEFSWDADALTIDDQYLLGRDLLVAPVFADQAEPVSRQVYLPRYANWYDWWTGQFLEGGQWLDVTVPLERIPLYARAGTAIPIADARQEIGVGSVEVTSLLLFAPPDGAIGASIELPDGDLLGVEHERGTDRARIFVEGILPGIRTLEIVGLPSTTEIVDAASPRVQLVPGDGSLPGLGGAWGSLTVSLDPGAYTTGLELRW